MLTSSHSQTRRRSKPLVLIVAGSGGSLIRFRAPLLKELKRLGCEVICLAPGFPPSTMAALDELSIPYGRVRMSRAPFRPFTDMVTLVHLTLLLRRHRPAILFAYTLKPLIFASLSARFFPATSTFSMVTGLGYAFSGNSPSQRLLQAILARLARTALRSNRVVFFQNTDDLALFRHLRILSPHVETTVVPGSGVDLQFFSPAPLPSGPLTFLLIARLLREKGLFEFAEAARIMKSKHPDLRFWILGPIDINRGAISREVIARWEDEGIIEYLGTVADVRPILKEASVAVLPSYREGTPRVLLEALAMARPIITTDAPGCRDTVSSTGACSSLEPLQEGANGFLVPVRDSESLARAMKRFVDTPTLLASMAQESRCLAEARFDDKHVTSRLLRAMGLASCGGPTNVQQ